MFFSGRGNGCGAGETSMKLLATSFDKDLREMLGSHS